MYIETVGLDIRIRVDSPHVHHSPKKNPETVKFQGEEFPQTNLRTVLL